VLLRLFAVLAAAATLAGAALVTSAVVATRPLWFGGYVSEAGVAGAPGATPYRLGVLLLALAMVLLGLAVSPNSRAAAVLLLLAGGLALLSGSVQCTTGCPLPPYEPTTTADLIHGGSSILAVAATGLAMGALAIKSQPSPVRTVSRIGFAVIAPLGLAVGLAIVLAGRGPTTAVLERAVLAWAVIWILAASVAVVRGSATT
jgi:Protein of unknown function (DUF998)